MTMTFNLRDERIRMLWTLLRWQGSFRNRQLREMFGMGSVQVSRLIAEFREVAGAQIAQDPKTKEWRPLDMAQVDRFAGDIEHYLTAMHESPLEKPTWFEDGRQQFLNPQADRFRLVRAACESGAGIEMSYASMTSEGTSRRLIFPHAIVRLSLRWHVRAWCVARNEYRDFNFGRMSAVKLSPALRPEIPGDDDWNRFVDIRIGPHRQLNPTQYQTVRVEYCNGAAARRIKVRASLAPYVLSDSRIAIDHARDLPPQYLLELLNLKEVEPFLFRAKGGS